MNIDDIWQDDLLDRRTEAQQLIGFIESVCQRSVSRLDKSAYTISVDAGYGEGKSYFLRRLSQELSLNYPVAFVDAWSDDLSNEPLIALMAALKTALDGYIENTDVNDGFKSVLKKSGEVLRIAGKGLAWRLLGAAVGMGGAEAIENVLSGASEDFKGNIDAAMNDVGQGAGGDVANASSLSARKMMAERLEEFENAKQAIYEMKIGLRNILSALDNSMIIIIIDELDRCRPTYAVKLLEEIKHLFDVKGLVFIFGTHGKQLGCSISGAYGDKFNGHDYMRRFIDREYKLRIPNAQKLIDHLRRQYGISDQQLSMPVAFQKESDRRLGSSDIIAGYMRAYGIAARDAYGLMDVLQVSINLIAINERIFIPLFLPLAIGQIIGNDSGILPELRTPFNWQYRFRQNERPGYLDYDPHALAMDAVKFLNLSTREIRLLLNAEKVNPIIEFNQEDILSGAGDVNKRGLFKIPSLLETVGRFSCVSDYN
jgi:hypothetical protein